VTYFHSYWTRPLLDPARPAAEQAIELWDFEVLTWLWSALELRRLGPLRLVTDARGLLAVQRAGLEWVYSAGISTALEDISADVDPTVFWAAGKLRAYLEVPAPCVSVDTDAVLWGGLQPTAPVMALHEENRDWGWYSQDADLFQQFGFAGPEWDWTAHPINAGVVYIEHQALLTLYAEAALRFMQDCSRHRWQPGAGREAIPPNALLFAEQRLLPMCARRLGQALTLITRMEPGPAWLPHNAECLHLWGAKLAYKCCPDARVAAVNYLREAILGRFPEARPTLARWALEQPSELRPVDREVPQVLLRSTPNDLTFSLLHRVRGLVFVRDPVLGIRRLAREGSMIWSAEVLEPEPGASCELSVGGATPVRVGHQTD